MYAEETRSAVTDAVGPAPSLLPRLGAVAISVTTTALDRESGVVCGDACVYSRFPGFGCGLWRVSRWVGLVLRLVCEVLVSVSCVSRLPQESFVPSTRTRRILWFCQLPLRPATEGFLRAARGRLCTRIMDELADGGMVGPPFAHADLAAWPRQPEPVVISDPPPLMTIALLTATLALIYLISIMHAQATPPDLDPRQLEEARARLWRLILPEQLLDFGEATPPTSPPAKGAEAASEKLRLRSAASLAQRVRHSIAELRTPTLQPQLWQNSWTYRPSAEVARDRTPLLVFINRGSGGRQGEATLVQLKALLSAHQVVDLSLGHAEQALQSFRTVGRFRVLVCGGDGTVGWVLSLLDNAHLEYTPPVAILPLGTGNDLARALGWGGGTRMGRSFVNLLEEVDSAQVALLDRWEVC